MLHQSYIRAGFLLSDGICFLSSQILVGEFGAHQSLLDWKNIFKI